LKAKKATFSSTDIVVNKNTMLELVSRFRNNYPVALKEATEITRQRDEIIAKAKEHNVDIFDLEKWDIAVYYRVPVTFEIVASCTLHADENGHLYWSYVDSKVDYDGKDPIPKFYKERKK
jgi:hypothetical protein